MKKKFGNKVKLSSVLIVAIILIWTLIVLYPFYNVIITSFMTQKEYLKSDFVLFPKEITFDAYKQVFANKRILTGYKSTLLIVLLGVPYNMFLTVTLAYALSKKRFPGKRFFEYFVIFTMYFAGGTIPSYLLIKDLGLMGSYGAVILESGVSVYYMILLRNYFMGIPDSLEEAAKLDGANDLQIMLKVHLPMSTPILATIFLFFLVDRWNTWYSAMLYLNDAEKWPLQLVLRQIVSIATATDASKMQMLNLKENFGIGVQMASVVVTMAPIMIAFPFLQKYFIQGLSVGAVKE